MNLQEQKLLELLELNINSSNLLIRKSVSSALSELNNGNSISVTKNIPVKEFFSKLPKEVKLCRIFALKANTKSKIERHTNSYQRTLTLYGEGDTKILENNMWKSNVRKSSGGSMEDKWLSVPENTWHQPIALSSDWVTVTFHTASESEIIDEYKD